ncbi:MAG: hypothetical protein ACK5FT_10360 [Sphingomonadales bacterium]|jgi:hypothetical protein
MKWILMTLVVLMAVMLQQFQCNRCDYSCVEVPSVKIVDAATGKDLFFGPGAIYSPDSVSFTDNTTLKTSGNNAWERFWIMQYDSMFSLYQLQNRNVADTFYIKNQSDIDTLHLKFDLKTTDCCKPYYQIKNIDFNGVPSVKKDGYWIFRKD